ncbi:hypothetical protein C8Q80DRAFT_604142 [Daedaleopsis nitida]|nr:hypothetical protein C8Q80DRAFT_604142 [Daedaleopsis nitida]
MMDLEDSKSIARPNSGEPSDPFLSSDYNPNNVKRALFTVQGGSVANGRARITLEIVLPTLSDVRRLQAVRAASAQLSDTAGTHPHPDTVTVKAERVEENLEAQVDEQDTTRSIPVAHLLRDALQELRNPDVKVKEEYLLNDEFLLEAYTWEGINHRYPIPVPKAIAEYGFHRPYIHKLYGGNPRDTFPKIGKEWLKWHGLDDWAFLSLAFEPHAPTRPGYPGLHFSSLRARESWEGTARPLRTFVRVRDHKWVYMGQYKYSPGRSLTTDAWKQQKQQVRRAWARGILNQNWGADVCLRIWFRKERGADYDMTKEDRDGAKIMIKDIRNAMTEEDIAAAYDRGEEEIGTYKMTCVGYDEEFVRVLERNADAYVAPAQKSKAPQKGKAVEGKRKAGADASANEDGVRVSARREERGGKMHRANPSRAKRPRV